MIKVLYITGWGRSGSTILGNVLGQIDGFVSVGEIRHIVERGLVENRPCGCGASFKKCEFWQPILTKAFEGSQNSYSEAETSLRHKCMSDRHLPLMLLPGKGKIMKLVWKKYLKNIENLYHSIASCSNSKLIVDSSKLPLYGYALSMIPGIKLYVVHLVRDPRSVSYSWMRKKLQPDKGTNEFLPQYNPLKSSWQWNLVNVTAEFLRKRSPERYYLLRYEDLMAEPEKSIQKIIKFTEETVTYLPFIEKNMVNLDVTHTVSGNPNRRDTGLIKLKPDDEWKVKMKFIDKALVTTQSWPLLLRYNYLLK